MQIAIFRLESGRKRSLGLLTGAGQIGVDSGIGPGGGVEEKLD